MAVKILVDTNIFIKFCRRLPLPSLIELSLENAGTQRLLSPVSIIELFHLWQTDTRLRKFKNFPQRYFTNKQ